MGVRTKRRWAVFLDKDGTLLEDVPFNVDPAKMRFLGGVREGLRCLGRLEVPLVVVSNQPGLAFGLFGLSGLARVERRLRAMFRECGASLSGFYFCPHHPDGSNPRYRAACRCSKPGPGLLLLAASRLRLDLSRSWMVGDILDDVEAGRRAGCRTILVDNGSETVWRPGPLRNPHCSVGNFKQAATLIEAGMASHRYRSAIVGTRLEHRAPQP